MSTEASNEPASAEEVLAEEVARGGGSAVYTARKGLAALRAACDSDGWVVVGPDGTLYRAMADRPCVSQNADFHDRDLCVRPAGVR